MKALKWIIRIIPAVIMLQTLFFKFSAAPESVYIFEQTGLGDAGRIGTGIAELIASIMLLSPMAWMGALLAVGLMSGALFSHLTVLGIEVMNDNGLLFIYALTVFISCSLYLLMERVRLNAMAKNFLQKA
jgi:hypothetical protein